MSEKEEKKAKAAVSDTGKEGLDDTEIVRATLNAQQKVKIMIPSTETKRDDVPVAVNGYTFLIQRDKVVEVPMSVVGVLNNAKMTLHKQVPREDGNGMELVPYEALRFPYQFLGVVTGG